MPVNLTLACHRTHQSFPRSRSQPTQAKRRARSPRHRTPRCTDTSETSRRLTRTSREQSHRRRWTTFSAKRALSRLAATVARLSLSLWPAISTRLSCPKEPSTSQTHRPATSQSRAKQSEAAIKTPTRKSKQALVATSSPYRQLDTKRTANQTQTTNVSPSY